MAHSQSEQRAVKNWMASVFTQSATQIIAGTRWEDCLVYAQRPKFQKLGSRAMLVIGDVRRKTLRIGMGRPAGMKRHEYDITLLVQAVDKDDQGGGDDFDQVMDQVETIMETLLIETTITDPIDGSQYRITKIGEEIDSNTHPPETSAAQGEVTFTGSKQFTVWVHYND